MKHLVELNFLVTDSTDDLLRPEDLAKRVDVFTEYLAEAEAETHGILDVTVDAVLAEGKVRVELWVKASTEAEAVEAGYVFVIPGIHAAGGSLRGLNHPALLGKKDRWENLPSAA